MAFVRKYGPVKILVQDVFQTSEKFLLVPYQNKPEKLLKNFKFLPVNW